MNNQDAVWRLVRNDGEFQPDFARSGFDDRECEVLELPWIPEIQADSGVVVVRQAFSSATDSSRRKRIWLDLEGMLGQVDVWIDGSFVGEVDCPHALYTFEVETEAEDHAVALEVRPSPQSAWQNGAIAENGITAPARLRTTGSARVTRIKALCSEATAERALLQVHAEIDCAHAGELRIRTTARSLSEGEVVATSELSRNVATGANRVRWGLSIENPMLWWPRHLGAQNLYELTVEVYDAPTEEASDSRSLLTGLRTVGLDKWQTFVNGEAMFVKGALLAASRLENHGAATLSDLADADIDLIYVSDGIHPSSFYEQADALGLLVWQQLPHVARDRRRKRHERIGRQVVDMIAHRPSVAAWVQQQQLLGAWPPFADTQRRAVEQSDPSRQVLVAPEPFEFKNLRARNQRFVVVDEAAARVAERIDDLRLHKYNPVRGVLTWRLDEEALGALSALRVIAGHIGPDGNDDHVSMPVYLINDTRSTWRNARTVVTLRRDNEVREHQWEGDIEADSCGYIGTARFPLSEVGSRITASFRVLDENGEVIHESTAERHV